MFQSKAVKNLFTQKKVKPETREWVEKHCQVDPNFQGESDGEVVKKKKKSLISFFRKNKKEKQRSKSVGARTNASSTNENIEKRSVAIDTNTLKRSLQKKRGIIRIEVGVQTGEERERQYGRRGKREMGARESKEKVTRENAVVEVIEVEGGEVVGEVIVESEGNLRGGSRVVEENNYQERANEPKVEGGREDAKIPKRERKQRERKEKDQDEENESSDDSIVIPGRPDTPTRLTMMIVLKELKQKFKGSKELQSVLKDIEKETEEKLAEREKKKLNKWIKERATVLEKYFAEEEELLKGLKENKIKKKNEKRVEEKEKEKKKKKEEDIWEEGSLTSIPNTELDFEPYLNSSEEETERIKSEASTLKKEEISCSNSRETLLVTDDVEADNEESSLSDDQTEYDDRSDDEESESEESDRDNKYTNVGYYRENGKTYRLSTEKLQKNFRGRKPVMKSTLDPKDLLTI